MLQAFTASRHAMVNFHIAPQDVNAPIIYHSMVSFLNTESVFLPTMIVCRFTDFMVMLLSPERLSLTTFTLLHRAIDFSLFGRLRQVYSRLLLINKVLDLACYKASYAARICELNE